MDAAPRHRVARDGAHHADRHAVQEAGGEPLRQIPVADKTAAAIRRCSTHLDRDTQASVQPFADAKLKGSIEHCPFPSENFSALLGD